LECIEQIERFTADGRERIFQDAMVQAGAKGLGDDCRAHKRRGNRHAD